MFPSATGEAAGPADEPDDDRRFVIHGVSWEQYLATRDLYEDRPGLRMAYLEGKLEIMSPSSKHELVKKLIARLIEAWAFEVGVDLRGHGSTTFQKEVSERGAEPDECYCLGRTIEDGSAEYPDLVIEVALSRSAVDKPAIYAGFGVPEVWCYRNDRIEILGLEGSSYLPLPRSRLLPALDVGELGSYVAANWKTQDIRPYVEALRARR